MPFVTGLETGIFTVWQKRKIYILTLFNVSSTLSSFIKEQMQKHPNTSKIKCMFILWCNIGNKTPEEHLFTRSLQTFPEGKYSKDTIISLRILLHHGAAATHISLSRNHSSYSDSSSSQILNQYITRSTALRIDKSTADLPL